MREESKPMASTAIQRYYAEVVKRVDGCARVPSKWVDVSDLARPIPIRPALERPIHVLTPKSQSVRDELKLGYGP